jgi:hypothetical protein
VPCYNNWAPFVGSACQGPNVFNTEFQNASSSTIADDVADAHIDLTEDLLIELKTDGSVTISMSTLFTI